MQKDTENVQVFANVLQNFDAMRENKYDDDAFFSAYGKMARSVDGLSAAGEWHALRALLPDFAGKRVLDIGCGYGWHCQWAAAHGAATVVGTDISRRMLAVAREKTDAPNVTYVQVAMEDMAFDAASFDVVISSLAFHYTPDLAAMCRRVAGWLAPGGDFVFSCEHPIFTAQGPQNWAYGPDGETLHWPVDRYFDGGAREAVFLGEPVTKYHRTIEDILGAVLDAGLAIRRVVEPKPTQDMLDTVEGMRDELRRPMMLLIAARSIKNPHDF